MRATVVTRAVAGAFIAGAVVLSASACGSSVDQGKLVNKLKSESEFKSMPTDQLNCVAKVAIKYGDHDKLNDYIDGKISAGSDAMDTAMPKDKEAKAEADVKKCVS
ncbi:MAG: hypothetical protein J2P17_09055 [Mycobacterium sp.]|nr:hypothetical protein [Mycobacterium sp.]